MVEARGLRRRYGASGGYEAVRDVSFAVAEGELFALLGTNGAGKTSTMEVLEGLAPATGGQVRVLGHDPFRERRAVRPRIGVMLQEGGFPSTLTVAETARMWAGTLTRPRSVAPTLELVDLAHRASTPVQQLSGGERRRLDLALAVLGRPDVLFLDEPTTGLDPQSRQNAWELIRALRAGGTTILLTTHYLTEAQELADRVAIMHRGRIAAHGTIGELVRRYPARIGFAADGVPALPELPGVRDSTTTGGRVTIRTDALQETLTALLTWAQRLGITLDGLDAREASLDEAFMAIAEEVPA
ncbi:multidrug ABC transporter ATP-binding protein [Virgisporangium aliadipatigenens]|uniref:Multidrug ABC transporter ATP-binding protein n=1 Tax=Virgisporangium aliadipatigenens TaxID=741659 RepID=A0A8J4DMX9_9ACTN|nr:multidrug ABC transporter ATP-binding protein [Virgisporangium aliadipatigenens]